jgi:hypothetical protein
MLTSHQQPSGAWKSGEPYSGEVIDTCFALLFLQRVNLTKPLTDKLRVLHAARPGAARKR